MKRYVELVCFEAIDDRIMFLDMRETVREFVEPPPRSVDMKVLVTSGPLLVFVISPPPLANLTLPPTS